MQGFVRYKVREKMVKTLRAGKIIETKYPVIIEEFTNEDGSKIELPSSLNGYLYNSFKNSPISNAKNAADVICPFLNYVKLQVIEEDSELFMLLREKGLYGLNFYHAASYLNYCIEVREVSRSTALRYTDQILDFYQYLMELNILDKSVKFTYLLVKTSGKKQKRVRENPFKNALYKVHYPTNNKKKKIKLNNMEEHIWQLFLQVSEKYAPEITLGIAFQMFGGLRRGEVVNLKIDSIRQQRQIDTSSMTLYIRRNQAELFGNRDIEISKCGVKKERDQEVFNFNSKLYLYYENHIKLRDKVLKEKGIDCNALFVDKNGYAIDGVTYERLWRKIKKKFLIELEENSYSLYLEYCTDDNIWGTHIGRGIFTNLCLEHNLAKNARELANLRGDKHEDSSQPYIDKFKKSKYVFKALNVIGQDI